MGSWAWFCLTWEQLVWIGQFNTREGLSRFGWSFVDVVFFCYRIMLFPAGDDFKHMTGDDLILFNIFLLSPSLHPMAHQTSNRKKERDFTCSPVDWFPMRTFQLCCPRATPQLPTIEEGRSYKVQWMHRYLVCITQRFHKAAVMGGSYHTFF